MVGGDLGDGRIVTTSAEAYSVSRGTWRKAADFPLPLEFASTLPLGDSFLVLGGYEPGASYPTIFEYEWANDDWALRPETLGETKHSIAAFYVSEQYCRG